MPIAEVLWPQERVDHIAQHGVRPEEFAEVCFGPSLVLRAEATGTERGVLRARRNRRGRPLFYVVIEFPGES